jgi:hypothetical protein
MLNLCVAQGAKVRANTVVELSDGSLVNFLYEMHGLQGFSAEFRKARRVQWLGAEVRVLPLDRIHASKKHVGRPKDLAHLPLIEQTIRLQSRTQRRK